MDKRLIALAVLFFLTACKASITGQVVGAPEAEDTILDEEAAASVAYTVLASSLEERFIDLFKDEVTVDYDARVDNSYMRSTSWFIVFDVDIRVQAPETMTSCTATETVEVDSQGRSEIIDWRNPACSEDISALLR